ncbi:MAG: flagellar FlbD family protein [Bryobacteraceae bacterium]
MIHLTRINRAPLVLNSDLIEYIEKTPDTVVSLTNGAKLLVLESPEEIVEKVVGFRQGILRGVAKAPGGMAGAAIHPFLSPKPLRSRASNEAEDEDKE